ncbi:MarR family transcriptional regulator [Desulfoluna sp.]|uniref:MarR family winged helix-turn-helix transcriptional regulator n=1 Tax=Desulfoluna sp. TaxID=2045199 RepID=UPI00260EFA65|nr:MarR family transcriptional regulator [Desulfoluna sp.]
MHKKPDYDLENSLGMLLDWASQFMRLELNRKFTAAGIDATSEQWKVMIILWFEDGLTQQQLAEKTHKSKVSLVKLVDGLERRGLVNRRPDPNDRRSNHIFLTPKGMSIQEQLIGLAKDNLAQATADINPQELALCINVLKQVLVNMKGCDSEID